MLTLSAVFLLVTIPELDSLVDTGASSRGNRRSEYSELRNDIDWKHTQESAGRSRATVGVYSELRRLAFDGRVSSRVPNLIARKQNQRTPQRAGALRYSPDERVLSG